MAGKTRRRTIKLRAEFRKEYGENWHKNKRVKAQFDKLRFPWKSRSYETVVQPGRKAKLNRRSRKNPKSRRATSRASSSHLTGSGTRPPASRLTGSSSSSATSLPSSASRYKGETSQTTSSRPSRRYHMSQVQAEMMDDLAPVSTRFKTSSAKRVSSMDSGLPQATSASRTQFRTYRPKATGYSTEGFSLNNPKWW